MGRGSSCQRSFTELVLRLFAEPALRFFTEFSLSAMGDPSLSLRMTQREGFRITYEGLRVTVEGFRMTSLASVILEPFGPERSSRAGPSTALRAGSAKGKNLGSCRALARKSQTDPLPKKEGVVACCD